MSKTGFAVAALVALAALGGATQDANAGGGGGKFKFHNFNHGHRPVIILGGGGFGYGCGYYREMWWETGSFYWKKQYYLCKGWW